MISNKKLVRIGSRSLSLLLTTVFVCVTIFPAPLTVFAQPVDPSGLDTGVGLPTAPRTTNNPGSIDTQTGIYGDIARGALNLAVCSGGSLTDRLKAVGQGAIDAAVDTGIREVLGWAEENSGLLEDIAAIGVSAALPVVGGLLSGVLGLGGGSRGPQVIDAPELQAKDSCLDAMARMSAQQVIQEVAWGVVNWVQTGFDGNPGFATSLDRRLNAIAERELRRQINRLVYSDEAQDVCSAYKDSVAVSYVTNYYQRNPEASGEVPIDVNALIRAKNSRYCNLESTTNEAIQEVATTASWLSRDEWRELGRTNPYQIYARTSQDIERGLATARQQELSQLEWGGGFLSWETCTLYAIEGEYGWVHPRTSDLVRTYVEHQGTDAPCIEYETTTPGSVVQTMVADVIGSDIRRAEVADEFNEIVASAGNLLISKITDGREGLRGASGFSVTNQGNFDAQVDAYNAAILLSKIREVLILEREVLARQEAVVTLLTDEGVPSFLSRVQQCSVSSTVKENAARLAAYLNNDFLNYSSLREKYDWEGNPFDWQPFVIEITDPVPIDWNGQPWDWRQEDWRNNTSWFRPGEQVERPNSDDTSFAIAGGSSFDPSAPEASGGLDLFEVLTRGSILTVAQYLEYEPYFFPGTNLGGMVQGGPDEFEVRPEWNALSRSYFNHPRALEPQYWYVWSKRKFQNGAWRNGIWNNTEDCRFRAGGWCYYPAFTPRKVEIISPVTYKKNASGVVTRSQCRVDADAGDHYFVLNGEDVWRKRVCSSANLAGDRAQWQDVVLSATPNTEAEKVLQRTERTNARAIGDPIAIDTSSAIPGLENQRELVTELETLERELAANNSFYNQAVTRFAEIEFQLHSQSDITSLTQHLNTVAGLLREVNDMALAANCSTTDLRGFIEQTTRDVVGQNIGPDKISWLGSEYNWIAGVQYRVGGDGGPTAVGLQCNLEVASRFADDPNHATAHYRITTEGSTSGGSYRERWGLFICAEEGNTKRTSWQEVPGHSAPAWELF